MDLSWIEAGAPLVTLASVGAAAWAFRHATGEADACQSLDDEVQRLREENRRLAEQLPEGQRLQELGEAIRTREASLERLQECLVQAQAATSRLEELQAACATREQALAEFQGRAAQLEPRVAELEGVFQEALEAQQTLEAARARLLAW